MMEITSRVTPASSAISGVSAITCAISGILLGGSS